jgi:tagatose-1,6-bisphosphate aldolase
MEIVENENDYYDKYIIDKFSSQISQINNNSLVRNGSTYIKVMEYYQEEKERFNEAKLSFNEMEEFIEKFFDPYATMKIKILENLDSSLTLGKYI